jgi:tetratricopeptide (TPR) repeat protein
MQAKIGFLKRPAFRRPLMIAAVVAVSSAVYFNALSNGFVYDDKSQVLENRWIQDIKHIPEIFTSSVWSFGDESLVSNYYRPLMHVIFMMNYYIFGLNPSGFHLVNIIFHAAVTVLVFILLLRLLKPLTTSLLPPFIAALLFATHPIHTEAVTWISGVTEPSYTFFLLLSFYFYIKSGEGFKIGYPLSLVLFFISTLCKETALTLPIILIAYDFPFGKNKNFFKYSKRYIPFFIIVGIYLVLRFNALGGLAPKPLHVKLSAYGYVINIFPLFMQYLWKLLLPITLNAFYILHPISSVFELKGILSIIVAIAFLGSALLAFKKNKAVFTGLLLIAAPLLPVLYIPGLGENVFTERYLYLPTFGFAILAALFLYRAKDYSPNAALSLTLALLFIVGLYSIQTIRRNYIWKDDFTLFKDTVEKSPDSSLAHNNLGVAYFDAGLFDEAIGHCFKAILIRPDYSDAYNNLGMAYLGRGSIDEAMRHFKIALEIKPDTAEAYYNLGIAYRRKGMLDESTEQFKNAIKLKPNFALAYNDLGVNYFNAGLRNDAIGQYETAIRLKPDFKGAYNNIGVAYADADMDKAIEYFRMALKLDPYDPMLHMNLSRVFEDKGLPEEARYHLNMAQRFKVNAP